MKQLKTILKQERKSMGLSLRQLDAILDIPYSNLSKIENGTSSNCSFKTVMKLCEFFKVDPWTIKR